MFWKIALVVLFILVVVYISYYYKYPPSITILQTTLANFYFDMLREKQPIVIEDRIVNTSDMIATWFKHNSTSQFDLQTSDSVNPTWIRNNYKYTLIHSREPCEVLIASAKDVPKDNVLPDTATIVALRLSANQSVLIPYHMHYAVIHTEKTIVKCVGVHDWITKIIP